MQETAQKSQVFESFFKDALYLLYKNHLYNYLCRRFVINREIAKSNASSGTVLELGCGISPILKFDKGVIQTDLSWRALKYLKENLSHRDSTQRVCCDAVRLPFLSESFERVICSEVIEHVEQDHLAVREISRVLKPGGKLYLTCPVHPRYFGFDDEFVGHFRRYEISDLGRMLSENGFCEIRSSPILGFLDKLIMTVVTRLFSSFRKTGTSTKPHNPFLRPVAWFLFPFYVVINYLLAFFVYAQAMLFSANKAVSICFQCRKAP